MISQFLLYSLKAALTLTLLYAPYTLMLQKEKFFRLNRLVLLCIIALSLLLPLCNISWMSLDNAPIIKAAHQQMIDIGIPVRVAEESITVSYQLEEQSTSLSWFAILAIVFFVGMTISVVLRCVQLGILSYVLRRKVLWTKKLENGIRVCCRRGKFTPYSWMHTIVISEEDWNDGQREIVLHETGHIRAHHSWDMLLLMLCQALQWYNPFAWMMGHSLADVHEYEADDYVLRQGVDQHSYMMLLVKKVAQSQGYAFVNGLNKSTLNKRILMMKETVTSSLWMRAKLLYLLPVCALILCAFATPNFTAPVEEALAKLENQPSQPDILPVDKSKGGDKQRGDSLVQDQNVDNLLPEECLPLQGAEGSEAEPLFVVDGKVVSRSELFDVDPATASEDKLAKHLNLDPKDIVSVTVLRGASATSLWGEQGKNGAVVIITKQGEAQDEKYQEVNAMVEDLASRIPGAEIRDDGSVYVNGKKVKKLLVNGDDSLNDKQESKSSTAAVREVEPSFEDQYRYYSEHVRYPAEAQEYGVTGEFMVDFYVETDGSVSEVKASKYNGVASTNLQRMIVNAYNRGAKANGQRLSDEDKKAIESGAQALLSECERVVKLTSHKWTPGYVEDEQGNRTPKRMKMSIPLTFRLQ